MKMDKIPDRNKTLWYLSKTENLKDFFMVLKFIFKRYLYEIRIIKRPNDELVVNLNGLKIHFVPLWNELASYNGIFVRKLYEPNTMFAPEKCPIIFDCGANIGLYTLRAATYGTSKIFSFEPNPVVFKRLVKNIQANNFQNIIPFNMGLSSTIGRSKLSWHKKTSCGHITTNKRVTGPNVVEVELMTLDEVVQRYNINSIDLIKLDVEGSEYEALLGAKKTLSITKRLVLEFHGDELRENCEALLISSGFRKVHEIPEHQFYINSSFSDK